jgi:hypothetical protein
LVKLAWKLSQKPARACRRNQSRWSRKKRKKPKKGRAPGPISFCFLLVLSADNSCQENKMLRLNRAAKQSPPLVVEIASPAFAGAAFAALLAMTLIVFEAVS